MNWFERHLNWTETGSSRKNILIVRLVKRAVKLCLNLAILFGFVLLIVYSYQLFTTHSKNPLKSSVFLILGFIGWILLVKLLKSRSRYYWLRYKGKEPSFKLTALSVIAILLVLTFAGVQPVATYKDKIVGSVVGKAGEWQEQIAVRKAEREVEKAEQKVVEVARQVEEYSVLFNNFRAEYGLQPLAFDSSLNELAEMRCVEISQPGGFSHEGIIQYNLGENIAMLAYQSDTNSQLIDLWADSPGHRANMLNPMYSVTGFARVGKYAVQLFS